MNDEQIVDYLRGRGRVEPPLDLIGSVVDAVADAPQRRASWFAPFIPAAAAIGAAAAVTVLAIVVSQDPNIGPSPATSPSAAQSPSNEGASSMPSPSALATPEPVSYVTHDGSPFSLIDSPEADALFENPDTCISPAGYTVYFPDDWYSNTALPGAPACSWFSPDFFEVADDETVPDEIAIQLSTFEGGLGQIPEWPRTLQESVLISGVDGFRVQDTIPDDPPDFTYAYHAWLDENALGLKITGTTTTMHGGSYELNKAVLDRIMASLILSSFLPETNPAADAIFDDGETCVSAEHGYSVEFPTSWQVIGSDTVCSQFGPESVGEVNFGAIVGQRIVGSSGSFEEVVDHQLHTIGGRPAVRNEYRRTAGAGGSQPPEWRQLVWLIQLGEVEETGPNLVFRTSTDDGSDYELNKAILDRMMLTLRVTE